MKESDLAKKIIEYFENIGYESYKEVCMKGRGGGNARCDIYFIKKENNIIIDTIAIETKLNMNLKLIEQSYNWYKYANKIIICLPSTKRKKIKSRNFAYKICESFGIGVIECSLYEIKEKIKPSYNKKYILPPLYEEQKKSIAGTTKTKYYTSFKHTVEQLNIFMSDKNEYKWYNLIKEIKHHYKNDNSAKNSLKKYINNNVIKGYYLNKKGGEFYLIKK